MSEEHPDPSTKWFHMRIMAYTGMITGIIITCAVIYNGLLGEVITSLFMFWGTVIGGYMGFSTARDGWGKK